MTTQKESITETHESAQPTTEKAKSVSSNQVTGSETKLNKDRRPMKKRQETKDTTLDSRDKSYEKYRDGPKLPSVTKVGRPRFKDISAVTSEQPMKSPRLSRSESDRNDKPSSNSRASRSENSINKGSTKSSHDTTETVSTLSNTNKDGKKPRIIIERMEDEKSGKRGARSVKRSPRVQANIGDGVQLDILETGK